MPKCPGNEIKIVDNELGTRRILRRKDLKKIIFSIFGNNDLILKLNENLWCMIMKILYL